MHYLQMSLYSSWHTGCFPARRTALLCLVQVWERRGEVRVSCAPELASIWLQPTPCLWGWSLMGWTRENTWSLQLIPELCTGLGTGRMNRLDTLQYTLMGVVGGSLGKDWHPQPIRNWQEETFHQKEGHGLGDPCALGYSPSPNNSQHLGWPAVLRPSLLTGRSSIRSLPWNKKPCTQFE